MRKLFLIWTIVLLSATLTNAATGNADVLWTKGNTFYTQKIYDSAVACFEKLAIDRPRNPRLYYNLGNAYYRLNRVGPAVLNYQRALQLQPDFAEARENLYLTQSRMTTHIHQAEEIFFIQWWDNATRGDRATTLALCSLLLFLVIVGLAMMIYFRVGRVSIPVQVPGILTLVWLVLLVFTFVATQKNMRSELAVVMQNDAPLMNMDQKAGKPLSLLPEGITLKVVSIKGLYAEVILPDGRKGWVELTWITRV